MSFQSFITQQVAALTERLNAIANNAKKIIELPWQSVLRPESEIHVSDAGTSFKIKIQQIFDWFYSIRQNQLLSANISILVNEITVAAGAQWIIGNINYVTISNSSFAIEYAADGYTRNDILVADKNNHIFRVIGPETVGISPTPPIPIDTVLVTIINVTDSTIGYTPPIIGGDYEKIINKQNSLAIDGTGTKYATVDAVNEGIAAIIIPDATSTVKGILKLTADLGGTADAPTTPTAIHKTGNESRTGSLTISNLATPSSLLLQNGGSSAGILSVVNVGTLPAFTGTTGSTGTLTALNTTGAGTVLSLNSSSTGKLFLGLNNNVETSSLDKFGKFIGTSADFSGNVTGANPTASNHLVTKAYADGLVVGLLDDRGSYNASTNLFPTAGGSGTSGAILKGDLWYVSVAGTLGGKSVSIGDSFRALVDTPAQVAANWSVLSSNIGYVPANDANVLHTTGNESKTGSLSITGSSSSPTFTAQSNIGVGIYGVSSSNYGVTGSSTTGGGVFGTSTSGVGVSAGSINGIGIRTNNSTGNTSDLAQFSINGSILSKIDYLGNITGNSFIKTGGLATQFLKADGSIDANSYATSAFVTGNLVTLNTAQNITATKNMTQINIARSASDFNGINITGQRSGANAGLIDIGSTTEGFAFKYGGSGSSIGFTGISSSAGAIFQGISTSGATGNIFQGTDGVVNVFTVNRLGNGYFAGNVGMGMINPASKLHILTANQSNSTTFDATSSFVVGSSIRQLAINAGDTSGVFKMSLQARNNSNLADDLLINPLGGNVGIGTNTPAVKLDVRGKFIVANNDFTFPSTGSLIQIDQGATSGNTYSRIGAFSTGGTVSNNLILNSEGGNVGISTTNPIAKLDVESGIQTDTPDLASAGAYLKGVDVGVAFGQFSQTGGYGSWMQSLRRSDQLPFKLSINPTGGRVLIGTSTDNSKDTLQVNGSISITGVSNTFTANTVTDIFNNMPIASSFVSRGDNTTGTPSPDGNYFLESFKDANADYGMQRITYYAGTTNRGKTYIRVKDGGTWSPWVEK